MVKSPLKIVLLNHCLDHCLVTVTGGPVIAPAPMVTAAGVTVNPVGGMPSETVPVIPSGTGESSSGVQLTEEPLARTAGVQLHVSVLGESGITSFPEIVTLPATLPENTTCGTNSHFASIALFTLVRECRLPVLVSHVHASAAFGVPKSAAHATVPFIW